MSDWPNDSSRPSGIAISTFGELAEVQVGLAASSGDNVAVWPSANLAVYVPVVLTCPFLAQMMAVFNGATASGNIDVGIYDAVGTRLVSIGSTAQSGVSTLQTFNITDTQLDPGLYYLAAAMDNGTGTVDRITAGAMLAGVRAMGVVQQATAFPLPSTATFAAATQAFVPSVAALARTTV